MPKTPRKPRAHTRYTTRHIGRPGRRNISRNRFPARLHSPTCYMPVSSGVGYAPEVVMSDVTDFELLNDLQKRFMPDELFSFQKLSSLRFANCCVVCDVSQPYTDCGHTSCVACLNHLRRGDIQANVVYYHACPICRTIKSILVKSDTFQCVVDALREVLVLPTPCPEDMEWSINDPSATRREELGLLTTHLEDMEWSIDGATRPN
ncbi:hypothetical protein GG344DRAFT_81355 [Lentinula edodes]|nr:hypothetical protein GG344DRAFT_81355 [Lentinula edodes]